MSKIPNRNQIDEDGRSALSSDVSLDDSDPVNVGAWRVFDDGQDRDGSGIGPATSWPHELAASDEVTGGDACSQTPRPFRRLRLMH
jgi:hypothetical protein